jgi:TatD DNase family protein
MLRLRRNREPVKNGNQNHARLPLYDAHNHLQDARLRPWMPRAASQAFEEENVRRAVVNGSCEGDWPAVEELARRYPQVIPSFGYHPWYVRERSGGWKENLINALSRLPSAIGEIGLDRWIPDPDLASQEEVFVWQLQLAADRDLPASIHCLKAWGRLYDLLRTTRRPKRGFLLHSFGGPKEMIAPLADLGAYFSLPGYFAHDRKGRQREVFLQVPPERFLIETDAPDQCLPPDRAAYPLTDPETAKPLNHPADLISVYRFASELLGEPLETLAARVEGNFLRLFGGLDKNNAPNSPA